MPTERGRDLSIFPDRSRNRLERVSRSRPYACVYRYKDNTVRICFTLTGSRQIEDTQRNCMTETADLALENMLVFEDKISRPGSELTVQQLC